MKIQIKQIDHEYVAEEQKIDFALLLAELLSEKGITKAQLAEATGKQKSYITRIMGGNANLTIETMARLLAAVGEELKITSKRSFWDDCICIGIYSEPRKTNETLIKISLNNVEKMQSQDLDNWRDFQIKSYLNNQEIISHG
ncbi:helix-turn-helix domain-containing protein [Snodgrassella sp. ESL0253]|uniref:helix-turn-helix domain-containing protein n=1 Tax=Snodgrassella sp. ESL0253 TaxID=2705031 RepID=UPI0015839332|nr:helix-turn-helix transcriptional regulator [Snodgrassella sp. ESL0253]NUE66949.1 helix-turn-helix transcriptional regulator [Snodgrassella sp. ESL0253]